MYNTIRSMFFYSFILVISIMLYSCSPIRYLTLYDGANDPEFDFSSIKTIGYIPLYWTNTGKEQNIEELKEKQIFQYCKTELEKRGYVVAYIDKKFITEKDDGSIICHSMEQFPDVILFVFWGQTVGTVNVPSQSVGTINWGGGGGSGAYGSQSSYNATVYNLFVSGTIWCDSPNYNKKIWTGQIVKGSPVPNFGKQALYMVHQLFYNTFPSLETNKSYSYSPIIEQGRP